MWQTPYDRHQGRPVSDWWRTGRRLVALPPGHLADLLVAIPASLPLILEPVLASPTTTRTPKPGPHRFDSVHHARPPLLTPTVLLARGNNKKSAGAQAGQELRPG